MKTITRTNCVICKGILDNTHSFPKFPIFMGTSEESRQTDICEDLNFAKCKICGCIQLSNLIPLGILYEKSHNSAIGKTWEQHHLEFYNFIQQYTSGTIIEVGGGNLHLAKHLEQKSSIDKVIVYDTNTYGKFKSNKIEMREEFFNIESVQNTKVDMFIHSHVMEHLYNPISDIKNMSDVLQEGGYMAIAIPRIDNMLKDNFTNAMNFEHTYMITDDILEDILARANLEIVETKNFSKYTKFVMARKKLGIDLQVRSYPDCAIIFDKFVKYHLEEVEIIARKLEIGYCKEDTFIFGAHIFTQYLLNIGLDEELFSNILDNDPRKIGNRLYGTNLIVNSPKTLKDAEKPIVVLKAI